MKKRVLGCILILGLMAVLLLALSVRAEAAEVVASGECGANGDNVTWTLDSDGGLIIQGEGEMNNYTYTTNTYPGITTAPWGHRQINSVVIKPGVSKIGSYAFYNCKQIMNVVLPNSISTIPERAFSGCSNLRTINIPDSVTSIDYYAFSDCTCLKNVILPCNMTSIRNYAFLGCTSLESVSIPNGVTYVPYSAFENCTSLRTVDIPESVTWIAENAFRNCSSLTDIQVDYANTNYSSEDGVLFDKSKMELILCPARKAESYTIPNGVRTIKNEAFRYCRDLTNVNISDSVRSIGNYAFFGCSSLISVSIPSSVMSIGGEAFYGCSSLTSVSIPNSVTRVESSAFYGCSSLTSVSIPSSVRSIGRSTFSGCSSLTSVNIPSSVTSIGDYAFSDCTSLTSVSIPSSVRSIEYSAFYGCSSLTSVSIPNSVTRVESSAFYGCSSLTSVSIPSSVRSIGSSTFSGCSSLSDVYYSGSKTQWEAISIGNSNTPLTDARIHYNSTGPRTLDEMLSGDPSVYDNDLAEIAANLSLKTYDNDGKNSESVEGYLQYDLGFDPDNIHSRNYGGSWAFTIATKEYSGDDADEILVIVAQGSTNVWELIEDSLSELDYDNRRFFGNYVPYKIVSGFYAEIVNPNLLEPVNLYDLTEQNKRYKILVTGHSLGGAAANLLAANLTARRHIGGVIGQSTVYCYTFGAIDSIRVDSPIVDGYKNIHNVYNELDTFSPSQPGSKLMKTGAGSRNGKFGIIEPFEYEYRSEEDKSKPDATQVIDAVNHGMGNYLDAVKTNKVENSLLRPESDAYQEWAADYLAHQLPYYNVAGCPVNIDVTCEGKLVGRVINNVVDESVTGVKILVDDDVKFIIYPDDRKYDLTITAFDEGNMVFYTQDMSGTGQVKTMANVVLEDGKTMTSEVGGGIEVPDVKLLVMDADNNEAVAEVLSDGTERPLNGTLGDALSWTYDPAAGTITVVGDVTSGSAVMAASYSGEGQMLSVGSITQSGGSAAVAPRAETIKLFWMDSSGKPLCASVAL